MSPNANEYKSVVGVDQVYIAGVSEDSVAAYTAGTPEYLAPAASISMKPKTSMETQYADNNAFDVASAEAETDLEVTITNLPAEMYAKLLGSHFDTATGTVDDIAGNPPYFALGFRAMKSNGKYRYFWYQKCQFSAPEEGAETKKDKATPKEAKLSCKAIKTTYAFNNGVTTEGVKRKFGDEDTTNFSATGWFSQVQVPGSTTPSALALSSSVPVDDATGISKTANLTLTYNNALVAGVINSITLLDDTQAPVAGAVTLDATKKIITIDPTASLDGSTTHTLVANVTDIYGQVLTSIITFTTTA